MRRLPTLSLALVVASASLVAGACSKSAGGGAGEAEQTARSALEAFKAKDADALAAVVLPKHRDEARQSAAKIFDSDRPKFTAMRDWDGATLEVRYAGNEALVHIGPADGRWAVLDLQRGDDGKWYWAGVHYSSPEDFAAWGATDPGAPRPACNGGGKHVDTRSLPEAWASRGGAPQGAVACAFDSDSDPKRFSFELGDGPEAADKAWRDHLSKSGWTIEDASDEDGFTFAAVNGDVQLRVFTSKHVEDLGWTTVELR